MSGPAPGLARARRAVRPGPHASRLAPRGQITWVTLLVLGVVAGAGILGWTWLPVYFDHYTVKQVVRDYMNQAIKNPDDEGLRHNMVLKIRALAEIDSVDEWGRPVRGPAIALEDRDVTWERDTSSQPPVLHVAFEYAREVSYPILGRKATRVFTVDLTNDLTVPNWGPPR